MRVACESVWLLRNLPSLKWRALRAKGKDLNREAAFLRGLPLPARGSVIAQVSNFVQSHHGHRLTISQLWFGAPLILVSAEVVLRQIKGPALPLGRDEDRP